MTAAPPATAPPDTVTRDLTKLEAALDAAIPATTDTNLLVATWNIRAFGDLTNKWTAGAEDSPKRDWHAVACIAAIISRFDVIALREARRSTRALRFLLDRLGPTWRVIASDVAEGPAGTRERLAFLYNPDRVQPSGLVGEIVLPPIGADPVRQFELNAVPRTIFDDRGANHFYDQIAWFSEPDGTSLLQDMTYAQQAGSFDFIPHIMNGLTRNEISWRVSDHYPLWAEFRLTAAQPAPPPRVRSPPDLL